MKSIFSKIIDKEIPAYIIEENAKHIAFLDVNPLTKGHLLIVPKKQIDYLFDLNTEDYVDLHLFAKRIAKALKNSYSLLKNRFSCCWFRSSPRSYSFNSFKSFKRYQFL